MAILAIFTGHGVDKSQYEALRKEVDWEHRHPKGVILQAAGFDKKSARVVDVWESQEALDDFLGKRLIPALQKLMIPSPQLEIFELHNLNVYTGADKFKIKQPVR